MKLLWYARRDDLWNAECACRASLCGFHEDEREEAEAGHFVRADGYRRSGNKSLSCGPIEPIADPNENNVEYRRILDKLYAKTHKQLTDVLETLEKSRQELLHELSKK